MKEWCISTAKGDPTKWEHLSDQTLQDTKGMQTCSIETNGADNIRFMRFQIISANDVFSSVHRLTLIGDLLESP